MNSRLKRYFSILLVTAIVILSVNIIVETTKRSDYVEDIAEIQDIKHGLFSVAKWKERIAEIVEKKVQTFELTNDNQDFLREEISTILNDFMDAFLKGLDDQADSDDSFFGSIGADLKVFAANSIVDIFEVKEQIPMFTELIMQQINSKGTTDGLKEFFLDQFNEQAESTFGNEKMEEFDTILDKYNATTVEDCYSVLEAKIELANEDLHWKSIIAFIFGFLVFAALIIKVETIPRLDYVLLIIVVFAYLIIALVTPMMEIDVRIDKFTFFLMGENIEFENQLIFYKSKSIYEVVRLLFASGTFQSILVAVLVFAFSIVFPLLKMGSSLAIVFKNEIINNRVVKFFALKSGKWSMADVFVVAIFMSFLGFKGIISSQLENLENSDESMEIITANYSTFGVGFLFFIAFTIGGIIISTVLPKYNTGE